jgi:hypothetical protein
MFKGLTIEGDSYLHIQFFGQRFGAFQVGGGVEASVITSCRFRRASRVSHLQSGVAAIDHKLGAGDERSFVAAKKDCAPSDLLRLGAAFEGCCLDQRL